MPTQGVSTVVVDGSKILLHKRADFRVWSLPGGRVEAGELVEAAAIRETLEETGLNVRLERKVGVYWKPQHNDIVTVFQARVVGGQIIQRSAETVGVHWFESDQLPRLSSTMKRYIADTLANHTESVEVTLHISPGEVFLRRFAWRLFSLMKR